MSCCGNPPKEKVTDAAELRLMLAVLRDQRTAWKTGDGLTTAGTVIGQYKKTIAQFEALIELVERTPMEQAPLEIVKNPDCLGRGSDNTPGCTCRLVFESLEK
jgi:hypothetical protein